MYVIVGIIVYNFVNLIIYSELDMEDESDREILDNKKLVVLCSFIIAFGWVIFMPIKFLMEFTDTIKRISNN